MKKYSVLILDGSTDMPIEYHVKKAYTPLDALNQIDKDTLREYEWIVIEAEQILHKDAFIHDGLIDELYEA
jgi:hypothetical protein